MYLLLFVQEMNTDLTTFNSSFITLKGDTIIAFHNVQNHNYQQSSQSDSKGVNLANNVDLGAVGYADLADGTTAVNGRKKGR